VIKEYKTHKKESKQGGTPMAPKVSNNKVNINGKVISTSFFDGDKGKLACQLLIS